MSEPSLNGRLTSGRFGIGNSGGPGNPFALQVGKLRMVLLETVTPDDLKAVVVKLVELAKGGDLAAAKIIIDRTCGRSFVERLPNPKPPTSGFPTHDDGTPLTLAEKKAFLRERIERLLGETGQTEQSEGEHEHVAPTAAGVPILEAVEREPAQ